MPEAVHEMFSFNEWGNDEAVRARNARARELRAQGFTVKSKTVDFSDLARDKVAFVYAWMGDEPLFWSRATKVSPETVTS